MNVNAYSNGLATYHVGRLRALSRPAPHNASHPDLASVEVLIVVTELDARLEHQMQTTLERCSRHYGLERRRLSGDSMSAEIELSISWNMERRARLDGLKGELR